MLTCTALDTVIDRLPALAESQDGSEALIAMLAEDSIHFAGLSVEEADWLRAHIYAAVAMCDTPHSGLATAREDLRTSSSPYVLAGIARVLRAAKAGTAWKNALEAAQRRIEYIDVFPEFRFDPPTSPCCVQRTCIQEIEAAIAGLNEGRDALASSQDEEAVEFLDKSDSNLLNALLQNQAGDEINLDDLLKSVPVVLALFYTRCMNPLKCSLTMSRLAACARSEPGLGYVGMSYDPAYDTPQRLRVYGEDRKFPFSDTACIVRARDDWDKIKDYLEVRVGYGAATVNSHAREVFLITQGQGVWRLPPDWLVAPQKILDLAARTVTDDFTSLKRRE